MTFKRASQLDDREVRLVLEQLVRQVANVERVLTMTTGLLLSLIDEYEEPPDEVYRAMVEGLKAYADHIISVEDRLEQLYQQDIARNN